MAIYLELPKLDKDFPYRCLENDGSILTTPHWHKEVEIILIVKGKVNLGVNDRPIQLKENEAVIIPSGEVHYVLASPGSERLVFQFDLNIFHNLMVTDGTKRSLNELLDSIEYFSPLWPKLVQEQIIGIMQSLYEEEVTKEAGYRYAIQSLMCRLVTILYREMDHNGVQDKGKKKRYSHDILEQLSFIFQYIEKNYTHPMTLEDIAQTCGFSTTYFAKFFKRHTGKTFVEFLNEYRIDKAKWMLINENLPVNEIAERVGFNSSKTFYRLFKQTIGMAPLKFKSIQLEKFE